ncbi:MAG: glycosyltransferase [Anaerolineales bacterium]|nr:glycosyltransferase [Anaerolineales bacterium]
MPSIHPRVSVLMSVYNSERYLCQAIDSILCQTWSDFEFLIVNDGSTDRSREIITSLKDPRIRLIDNSTNIGLTKSLNRGLELAGGEYIARQDADDVSYPTRLERQVEYLDSHPDVALLGTRMRIIDESGKKRKPSRYQMPLENTSIKWSLMFGNPIAHTSVMYRRSIVWDRLKGYDEQYLRSQDFELWSRLLEKYNANNLPDILVEIRRHSESIMAGNQIRNIWLEKIISDNLARFSGSSPVPEEWSSSIVKYIKGQNINARRLLEIDDHLYPGFCQLQADAKSSKEIQRIRSDQRAKMAYISAPHQRSASIQTIIQAIRLDPGVVWRLPIFKYIIRLAGGKTVFSRSRGT